MDPLSPIGCEGNIPSDSEHRRCLVPPVPSNFRKIDLRGRVKVNTAAPPMAYQQLALAHGGKFPTSDAVFSRDISELEFS